MKNIGKARYGVIDNGVFGTRIVTGMITGIRFTEDKPVYELSFGKDKWWVSEIYDDANEITLKLGSLGRIEETCKLKIKYQ